MIDLLQQAKVYLKPGEAPPKGVSVKKGLKGGRYYESTGRQPAQQKTTLQRTFSQKKSENRTHQPEDSKMDARFDLISDGKNVTLPWDTFKRAREEKEEDMQVNGRSFGKKGQAKVSAIHAVADSDVKSSEIEKLVSVKKLPPVVMTQESNGKYLVLAGAASLVAAWVRGDKYVPATFLDQIDVNQDTHYMYVGVFDEGDVPTAKVEKVKAKLEKQLDIKFPKGTDMMMDVEDHLNKEFGEGSAEYYRNEGDLVVNTPKKRKYKTSAIKK